MVTLITRSKRSWMEKCVEDEVTACFGTSVDTLGDGFLLILMAPLGQHCFDENGLALLYCATCYNDVI